MKKLFSFILFIQVVSFVQSQKLTILDSIIVECFQMQTDEFGDLYIINENTINKYSPKGKFLFSYQNFSDGEISSLDISNPLKPMVFHKDFNILKILDRNLSEIATININDKYENPLELICSYNDINYWVYDEFDNKIKNLDKNFNVILESEPLFQILESFNKAKLIKVSQEKIYFLNENGISVLDFFGNLIHSVPIHDISQFQVYGNIIFYYKNNEIVSFNLKTLETKSYNLKDSKLKMIEDAILSNKYLYIYSKNLLKIFLQK